MESSRRREPFDWEWLRRQKTDALLNEEAFIWLREKDDERAQIWMLNQTDERVNDRRPSGKPSPGLSRLEEIIFSIDLWDESLEKKIRFLRKQQEDWGAARTPDSDTKWLDPKNEEQLRWAWEYLRKQNRDIRLPAPTTLKDFYVAVLASLDDMSQGHPDTKKVFLDKMRKTWSQKKYRDSEDARKQVYLPLNPKAQEGMKWLAEQLNEKAHKVVERLIAEEVQRIKGRA